LPIESKKLEKKIHINVEVFNAESSSARELAYLLEHTTHHLAMIKISLNNEIEAIKMPENFGVALTTIHHRNSSIKTNQ
jgi:dihydroorotase-like cyclic amidohydrolase